MKIITREDIRILGSLFKTDQSELIVLSKEKIDDQPGLITSVLALNNLVKTNPLKHYTIINLLETNLGEYYSQANVRAILNFGNQRDKNEINFSYINNPDGSIRWMFPSNCKKPHFLNLFNSSGFRSTCIRQLFKLGWKVGLSRPLTSGRFSLFAKSNLPINQYLKKNSSNWSLFTGTVGPNRKIVLELNDGTRTHTYIKIPISEASEQLISNESLQLNSLSTIDLQHSEVPDCKRNGKGLELSNIKPLKPKDGLQLTALHLKALQELYTATSSSKHPIDRQFKTIHKNLDQLKSTPVSNLQLNEERLQSMLKTLDNLYKSLKSKRNWVTGLTHGDFTPWNMFLSKDKIHIYDWELANQKMPILYDVFHFIFQSGVLIKRSGYQAIEWEIEQIRVHPVIKGITHEHSIDFEQYKQFYLLQNISSYLVLYSEQEQLHKQAHWLIQCWVKALDKEKMKFELRDFVAGEKRIPSFKLNPAN